MLVIKYLIFIARLFRKVLLTKETLVSAEHFLRVIFYIFTIFVVIISFKWKF